MSEIYRCGECAMDVVGKPRANSDFIDCPRCREVVGYAPSRWDLKGGLTAVPRMSPPKPLPTDAKARKGVPVYSGFLAYFPLAVAVVAEVSRMGNDQHNPGKPLHWDRAKSGDELDADARHLLEAGTFDDDGARHSAKHAWRAMANLQKELEAAQAAGIPFFKTEGDHT